MTTRTREARIYEAVAGHLNSFKSAPFLFIGAGFARRYLNLPSWSELLEEIAAYTTFPYGFFVTRGEGSNPKIASAIAEALHDAWWIESRFKVARDLYGDMLRSRSGPLKVEVANLIR